MQFRPPAVVLLAARPSTSASGIPSHRDVLYKPSSYNTKPLSCVAALLRFSFA